MIFYGSRPQLPQAPSEGSQQPLEPRAHGLPPTAFPVSHLPDCVVEHSLLKLCQACESPRLPYHRFKRTAQAHRLAGMASKIEVQTQSQRVKGESEG